MVRKIIEAVLFAVVIPASFATIAALSGGYDVMVCSIAMGVYALVVYSFQIVNDYFHRP